MVYLEKQLVFPVRYQRVIIMQWDSLELPYGYGTWEMQAGEGCGTSTVLMQSLVTEIYRLKDVDLSKTAEHIERGCTENKTSDIVALVVCPPASPDGSDKKAFEARLLQLLDHLTPNTGYIRQLVFFSLGGVRVHVSIDRLEDPGATYDQDCAYRQLIIDSAIRRILAKPILHDKELDMRPLLDRDEALPSGCHHPLVYYPLCYSVVSGMLGSNGKPLRLKIDHSDEHRFEVGTHAYHFLTSEYCAKMRSQTTRLTVYDNHKDSCHWPFPFDVQGFPLLTYCSIELRHMSSRMVALRGAPLLKSLTYEGCNAFMMCNDLSQLSSDSLQNLTVLFTGSVFDMKELSLLDGKSHLPHLRTLSIIANSVVACQVKKIIRVDCTRAPRLEEIEFFRFHGQLYNDSLKPFQGKLKLSSPGRLISPSRGTMPQPTALECTNCRPSDVAILNRLLEGTGAEDDAIDARSLETLDVAIMPEAKDESSAIEMRPCIRLGAALRLKTLRISDALLDMSTVTLPRLEVLHLSDCTLLHWRSFRKPEDCTILRCIEK